MDTLSLAGSVLGGFVVGVLVTLLWTRLRSGDARESARAHEAAQQRSAPVELDETDEFGVTAFTDHHSGERIAVGNVEGFVAFTEDVPGSVSAGDVIAARVHSFNDGRTSADATFQGRA